MHLTKAANYLFDCIILFTFKELKPKDREDIPLDTEVLVDSDLITDIVR